MSKFLKFFPLVKVDVEKRMVYGLVTAEAEDRDGETCHYETTKVEYQKVNEEMAKTSDGENIMPLREMHSLIAAGAGKAINFDDARKQIKMAFYVSDNSTWQKVLDKVLLGFSQGGKYLKRWAEKGTQFYTAEPGEVSLVDRPCLAGALIEYAKADGSVEMYKTAESKLTDADVDRLVKALVESIEKGVKYLVAPDHLPYTDANGKPNHRLMGAAWAALHGGYRGNKYEGPDKSKAIAHLKEIYHSEGMTPPGEKLADLGDLLKELDLDREFLDASELDTRLKEFQTLTASLVAKLSSSGETSMKPEQIKKCAEALGISEAEFVKLYVEGDALEKGKKGLAALHAHLKKALAHHEKMAAHHDKMSEMHKAHGEMHSQMAEHMANCMKAHGACMDGEEADKVAKALLADLEKKDEKKTDPETIKKADVETMIQDAIKKAVEALPKGDNADKIRVIPIPRADEKEVGERVAKAANAGDPMAV